MCSKVEHEDRCTALNIIPSAHGVVCISEAAWYVNHTSKKLSKWKETLLCGDSYTKKDLLNKYLNCALVVDRFCVTYIFQKNDFVVIQGHTVATTYPEQVQEGMKVFFFP